MLLLLLLLLVKTTTVLPSFPHDQRDGVID